MDTTQWLILSAAVIIALILVIWLSSNSKRRKLEEQRSQAEALRARADESRAAVQDTEDRASVAGQIAQDARAEADEKAEQAARLEAAARDHATEAQQLRSDYDSQLREADLLDPDVRTDDEGHRLDQDGRPHEREDGRPQEREDGRIAPARTVAASAVPSAGPFAGAAMSEDDDDDLADAEDPFGRGGVTDTGDHLDSRDSGRGSGSTRWEPPQEDRANDEGSRPQAVATHDEDDDGGIVQAAPAGAETHLDPYEVEQDEPEAQQHQRREFSEPDEVRDGGYGVGSAAPIHDGAQPFGHAVKAWNDTRTFLEPGGHGYDGVAPDVWFYDAEAAQAAGFSRAGD